MAPQHHRLFPAPEFAVDETPAFGRNLRIALAMKGGVSLAVWIGGAVAELDVLRRIRIIGDRATPAAILIADPDADTSTPPEVVKRAVPYAQLLMSRGYDQIEFDVLAGASAGGLNAVLYAAAQRAGVGVDGMFQTWMTAGAIWDLLRKPGYRGVESALRGDGYFWEQVCIALEREYRRKPAPQHAADHVVVDLSATVVDHDDPRDVGIHERGGHFHFIGDDRNPSRDLHRAIPASYSRVDVERLAYAARTTSSFPGAFEPALIWSHSGSPDASDTGHLDMSFAFHAQRGGSAPETARPYRVIDGGVTDNIPIDRAYRAIRDLQSETFADRAIIYLEPDPKNLTRTLTPSLDIQPPLTSGRSAARSDRTSRFVSTIRAALGLRGIRESGEDEIDQIESARRSLALQRGRNRAYAAASAAARATYSLGTATEGYVRYRQIADVGTLERVLSNPSLWQLGTDLVTRSERMPVRSSVLERLDTAMDAAYSSLAESGSIEAFLSGSQALLDGTRSAIGWLRDLEQVAFEADRHALLLNTTTTPAAVRTRLIELSNWVSHERDVLFDVLVGPRPSVAELHLLDIADDDVKALAIATQWIDLEKVSGDSDGIQARWGDLDEIVAKLRVLSAAVESLPGWTATAWAAIPQREDFLGHDLAPFAAANGIPEPMSGLRFGAITAAERPHDDLPFEPLRKHQLAHIIETWMKLPFGEYKKAAIPSNIPRGLDADSKLAGTTLAHFGAFLSADWRSNDWWWGRLDAAAGASRFLDSLPALDGSTEGDAEDTVLFAQSSVLRQAASSKKPPFGPGPATGLTVSELMLRMVSGAHSLKNLRPGYLVAIASRGVRIVVRAIGKKSGAGVTVASRVLLPPLLVFAPLVAHPLRAIAAFAVLVGTSGLIEANTANQSVPPFMTDSQAASTPAVPYDPNAAVEPGMPAPPPVGPPILPTVSDAAVTVTHFAAIFTGIIALLLVVWAAFGVAEGFYRRGLLRNAIPDLHEQMRSRRINAAVASTVFLAGSVAAFVIAGVNYYSHALVYVTGTSTQFWMFFGAGVALAISASSTSHRMPATMMHRGTVVTWLIVIAAIVAVTFIVIPREGFNFLHVTTYYLQTPLAWITNVVGSVDQFGQIMDYSRDPWIVDVGLGVSALAMSLVLGWGWLGGIKSPSGILIGVPWLILVSLVTAIVVVVAATAVDVSFAGNVVISRDAAIVLAAWFFGAHAFWWLGELGVYMLYPAEDTADFSGIPVNRKRAATRR